MTVPARPADLSMPASLGEAGRQVLHDADPQRLAACFRSPGAASLIDRLRGEARFETRLLALLAARHAIPFHHLEDARGGDAADRIAAGLDRAALEALALRCGMVAWAGTIAREVRKSKVEAMIDRFGEAAFRAALAHRDLAGGDPGPDDLDELEAAVRRDGARCLAAWIALLPAPLATRVRLKWPSDAALPEIGDAAWTDRGPAILRRLVAADGSR